MWYCDVLCTSVWLFQEYSGIVLQFYSTDIFFCECRDGVSESQFNQVLNKELDQIIEVIFYCADKKCLKYEAFLSVNVVNLDFKY